MLWLYLSSIFAITYAEIVSTEIVAAILQHTLCTKQTWTGSVQRMLQK